VQALHPLVHGGGPDRELAPFAAAQRKAPQQADELAAFQLARHRPHDLRTARSPGRHGIEPVEPGHAHDVEQRVRVVGSLVERHGAEPRPTAIVRRDHERSLGLDESCERVAVQLADALRSRDGPRLLC
jgi:hypothetical protein